MTFIFHPNLANKATVIDLPLCCVMLEDESQFPWFILVPRRPGCSKIMDLDLSDQWQLMQEIDLAQKVLWKKFNPVQINVAALGNQTPQLHIHIIARFTSDSAWPQTVWNHPIKKPYLVKEKESLISELSILLQGGCFEKR